MSLMGWKFLPNSIKNMLTFKKTSRGVTWDILRYAYYLLVFKIAENNQKPSTLVKYFGNEQYISLSTRCNISFMF